LSSGGVEPCLGLLESRTIARGIEAADAMAKEAPVALHTLRAIEPGRELTLLSGAVDDVRLALRRGRAVLREDLVDELFLPGAHPAVIDAVSRGTSGPAGPRVGAPDLPPPGADRALGLVECGTVASTLLAADAAAKEAAVRLLAVRFGAHMAGKGLIAIAGELADVESAVAKAASSAEERGTLVRTALIPRPNDGLIERVLDL
jgi:microcompartment protein CcmL/EutN